MNLEDEEIVKRVNNGDIGAFGELYEKYHKSLIRYACRYVNGNSEDIVQEVFLKLIEKQSSKNVFRHSDNLLGFLRRCVHNKCVTHLRGYYQKKFIYYDNDYLEEIIDLSNQDKSGNDFEQTKSLEENDLISFIKNSSEVIDLHYLNGFSYDEIANKMQWPIGTVKSRLFRSKLKLRDEMSDYSINDFPSYIF